MNSISCNVNYKKKVKWVIHKKNIEYTLLGLINSKSKPIKRKNIAIGLLFLDLESAGKMNFINSDCFGDEDGNKICHKVMKDSLIHQAGKKNSVHTPLSIVNFHTHPLNCYISEKCIWGWPSAQDLGSCLSFAKDKNLTHVIFTIEGTYIIDVNYDFIKNLKSKEFNKIKQRVIKIFQYTHLYRISPKHFNSINLNFDLDKNFKMKFLDKLNLKENQNIVYSWINLVNNLTLNNLNKLSETFGMLKIINNELLNYKIFNIQFKQNNTIQWNSNLTKYQIFEKLKSKNLLDIKLPEKIEYIAPFISGQSTLECL